MASINFSSFYSFSNWRLFSFNLLIIAALLLLFSPGQIKGNDDGSTQFFRRNAKWINLPSGGGSLVSGRGNFRPGFHSTLDSQSLMAEPLFGTVKRSSPPFPPAFALFNRDAFEWNPMLAGFARRR